MKTTTKSSIQEQIKQALDGRTQRWLCFKAEIPESELSRKMKGKEEFTKEEINRINILLNCNIN